MLKKVALLKEKATQKVAQKSEFTQKVWGGGAGP